MADTDLDLLQTALKRHWSRGPSQKAKPYVHAFSAAERGAQKSPPRWSGITGRTPCRYRETRKVSRLRVVAISGNTGIATIAKPWPSRSWLTPAHLRALSSNR